MMMSSTSDDTILPKAAPIMIPTDISRTLPRIANSLNSLSIEHLLADVELEAARRAARGGFSFAETLTRNRLSRAREEVARRRRAIALPRERERGKWRASPLRAKVTKVRASNFPRATSIFPAGKERVLPRG